MTTTPFTTFAFPANGAPTARTTPVRLSEVHNVLDFGADPTGGNASATTAAIQAAVDWTSGANRGTIYFPPGFYNVTAPITFNATDLSICFRGEVGTNVSGSNVVNGYIFDRHLATPNNTAHVVFEKMGIQNSHAGPSTGCVRLGSTKSGVIRDCGFNGFIGITTEDAVGQSSASIHIENSAFGGPGTTGSHYIIIGGGGAIQGCNMPGADVAVRAYGEGLHIAGNRSERCNTSFLLGLDSGNNNVGLRGFSLLSTSTEGCWTAYDLAGLCEGFVMAGIGSNSHGSDNSGTVPFIQGGQYGIRIRADCARGGVIQSAGLSGAYDVGAFVIANATARGNLVIRECSAAQSGGIGTTWIFPSNAYTALFYNNNEDPAWTYSQLPSGGNVFEGDEFNITDSNTATWGATAAGSGSNNVLVRWNGSVWTVVGK